MLFKYIDHLIQKVLPPKCLKHFSFPVFIFFISLYYSTNNIYAQNIGINEDGSTPESSAILDIKSTNKGLLIPRVFLVSVDDNQTIKQPSNGLLVFNTNDSISMGAGIGFYYNIGSNSVPKWEKLLSTFTDNTSWSLYGNSGLVANESFLGTSDDIPLNIKVNNKPSGMVQTLSGNTSLGYQSLSSLTSGTDNTALGKNALSSAMEAYSNVALGVDALKNATSVFNIVAVGDSALFSQGTVLPDSLSATGQEGVSNTAVGSKSMFSNTFGFGNTALGSQSLFSNSDGSSNTAIGTQSMMNNLSGLQNTAVGGNSLMSNTIGNFNVSVGYGALESNDTSFNTAVGTQALGATFKGYGNTAIGDFAGYNNTVGSYNTFVGKQAINGGFSNNSTAVGYLAQVTASNQVRIGGRGTTSIGGPAAWTNLSDSRLKKNVDANVPGLDFIMLLRPVTYLIDEDAWDRMYPQTAYRNNPLLYDSTAAPVLQTGFLAQEVEAAAESIGYSFNGVDPPKNSQDMYGLRYATFVVPLTKAVQEQQQIIDGLNREISDLKLQQQQLLLQIQLILDRLD